MVKVYGKSGCGKCIATERDLKKNGVEFEKKDITKDEAAYARVVELGYQGVPVVETETDHWNDYKPEKLKQLWS